MSFSLSLAIVRRDGFTPTDYLAVVLMIDAQCAALSATLSSKDALASRWYAGLTLLGQVFAWSVVVCANHSLADNTSPPANKCLSMLWMFTFDGEDKSFGFVLGFKVYWYMHALDLIHSTWLATCHTFQLDRLEKIDREQRGSYTGNSMATETGFGSLRGTPFSNWLSFILHPILLIVVLENHIKGIETSAWGDWGQVMPLTMLVLGVGHWFYLNLTQLYRYTQSRTQVPDDTLVIPLDASRMIAMGAGPSETGEVVYKLLTATRSGE